MLIGGGGGAVGLSVSESVQRESEQLANEGTSVNEGWKVVSIYF